MPDTVKILYPDHIDEAVSSTREPHVLLQRGRRLTGRRRRRRPTAFAHGDMPLAAACTVAATQCCRMARRRCALPRQPHDLDARRQREPTLGVRIRRNPRPSARCPASRSSTATDGRRGAAPSTMTRCTTRGSPPRTSPLGSATSAASRWRLWRRPSTRRRARRPARAIAASGIRAPAERGTRVLEQVARTGSIIKPTILTILSIKVRARDGGGDAEDGGVGGDRGGDQSGGRREAEARRGQRDY